MNDNYKYINRELSWVKFNELVLQESYKDANPLFERLRFLSIVSSNFDEFFMVRVAGLKEQIRTKATVECDKTGWDAKTQIKHVTNYSKKIVKRQYIEYKQLNQELSTIGYQEVTDQNITKEQQEILTKYFYSNVYPIITPLTIDVYHPFPMIPNTTVSIGVLLEKNGIDYFAVISIREVLPRLFYFKSNSYIFIENIIKMYINDLFVGYNIKSMTTFRITRNADFDLDNDDVEDLIAEIESKIKSRNRGRVVRLEINQSAPIEIVHYLTNKLKLKNNDIYFIDGPIDLSFLMKYSSKLEKKHPKLSYEVLNPQRSKELDSINMFKNIDKKDIVLFHPYDSFNDVVSFITQAAEDDNVLAIRQTLYRTSKKSPIMGALKKAAENGKEVTVLFELKARFDEANNIYWAREIEKVGGHVIYGIPKLKTHCKISSIIRKNENGNLDYYTHLATGNYNKNTAKIYTDIGILTKNRRIGMDAVKLFNFLSSFGDKPYFNVLKVSPDDIYEMLNNKIDNEIEMQKKYRNGHIILKFNQLTQKKIINKLYIASQAGVKVDLIIRGVCCLLPGVQGMSENITVISIIGRFLEHSRVYYFNNNNEEDIFISSADLMTRNLHRRVEVATPVFDKHIKERIKQLLSLNLQDNVKSRLLQSDGSYKQKVPTNGESLINSQITMYKEAYIK